MMAILLAAALALAAANPEDDARRARDRQDREYLAALAGRLHGAAAKAPKDAKLHYRAAAIDSYLAEVALEFNDRPAAKAAAEAGIRAAQQAVALQPIAEHHRILGTLCGQIIPANILSALKYGQCALESINRALELDPKSYKAHMSRGVGNLYLPPAFGGGPEKAVADFRRAVELNARSDEAHLWLGLALRKANRNAEARQAIQRSVALNPNRPWARQQLEKTPAE